MKPILLASLALVLASPAIAAEWHNTLQPKGKPAAPLTLTRDGQPLYSIVVPAGATPQGRQAAEELRHWIHEMTGADMKVDVKTAGPVISLSTKPDAPAEQYEI